MKKISDEAIAEHAYAAGFRGPALVTAVAVALAESRGVLDDPGDEHLEDSKWGPSIGLWQIRSLKAEYGTGKTRDEKANEDPATNARHAYQISDHGRDFSPWSAYKFNRHLPFMGRARAAVAAASKNGGGQKGSGQKGGGQKNSSGKGGGRIVLDLKELAKFESLMETSRGRVAHSLRQVEDIVVDLKLAGSTHEHAAYLTNLFSAVTNPAGLPLVVRHLEWETHLIQRIRRLAAAVDGENRRLGPEDLMLFLQNLNGRAGLPEMAVLEAITAAGLRTSGRAPARKPDHDRPRAPSPPASKQMNTGDIVPAALRRHANGRLPASVLVDVGEGERLSQPAAQHFRRMDAAARADGVDLRVNDGYRTFSQQNYHYQRYLNGQGPEAAAPGRSHHGWGLAVDLYLQGEASTWLRKNASRYGFFNDVAGEPWHWTYRPR